MARDAEALINSDEELSRLFGGRPTQYRKSKSLPKYTGEAARVCARINRIFFDDPGEAYRLFHELIPEAGEGVEFSRRSRSITASGSGLAATRSSTRIS